jgi:hypothetical protein
MHHHLFPTQDTYISNKVGLEDKNFGITEILKIGTFNENVRAFSPTKTFSYIFQTVSDFCITNFTGQFSGSLSGSAIVANGIVNASASFSSSYFSGSVNGAPIAQISGGISGSVLGTVTGSIVNALYIAAFSGSLTGSNGTVTGTINGSSTINQGYWYTTQTKFVDRTLIQFNLDTISASISAGEITSPRFFLNLKVANEYQLPIAYTVYAFPVSQSWDMGNGFWSDGGSSHGASWFYRDQANGNAWYSPITASVIRPLVDFLNNSANATASFAFGGGTWYYTSSSTQSFAYESSDISMDVTNIVLGWISGSIPNHGFVLISSDEIQTSGSGFSLSFYSRDTNTISYPYLDVAWDDSINITGSLATSSIDIVAINSGISASIQSGSSISIQGGISGSFSGSSYITTIPSYVTASSTTFTNTDILSFTGSFSGSLFGTASYAIGRVNGMGLNFYTDKFVGDINGTASVVTSGSVVGQEVSGSVTGSFLSSFQYPITSFSGSVTGSSFNMTGQTANAFFLNTGFYSFGGFFNCMGTAGNIIGDPVIGNVIGLMSVTSYSVVLPQDIILLQPIESNEAPYTVGFGIQFPASPYNILINEFFNWTGDMWNSSLPLIPVQSLTSSCSRTHIVQSLVGIFTTGVWSGSSFVAYYSNFGILMGTLSGSLGINALLGTEIDIPIPSGIDPYAYAYVNGRYMHGTALGIYQVSGSNSESAGSYSASFNGQFINGDLLGAFVDFQLSGSIFTSSFSYTASIETTSSVLQPLNTNGSFTVIVKNLKPEIRSGDMVRVDVLGRRAFPLKVFEKTSQQTDYFVPELLPSSSYYAIKDNMSEEIIVDFDNYTRLSSDYPGGNYFTLDTTGLAQERFYRILIRIVDGTSVYTFDNGDVFKITR